MEKQTLRGLLLAAGLSVAAVALFLWETRSPALPGEAKAADIICAQGHTTRTTFAALYRLPAGERYNDLSPGGHLQVKCPVCGQWSNVYDPNVATTTTADTPSP